MSDPARKRHYTPEPSATNAPRQRRLRERRKAEGWRRVSVWLSPEQAGRLETLGGDAWLGRTVKTLLGDAMATGQRLVSDTNAAQWQEADSLTAQGLSWAEIARRWNSEGRRTPTGAEYRGPNIAREWKKWKGGGK